MAFADIDGLAIHYHAPRDPAERRGQRVLYVHGTGCNAHVWDDHLAAIADTHTPVALDLPGHGRSGGRGFRGVADYTHVVMELGRALGWNRFVIVGHSMGGGIAITAALYYPERLAGLVLVDTGARLRVNPDILRAARVAADGGPAPPTDRSWGLRHDHAFLMVGTVSFVSASDYTNGAGSFTLYPILTLEDGSVLWLKSVGTGRVDGEKTQFVGTLTVVGGKGRFGGTKGDGTLSGTRYTPLSVGADLVSDYTVNIKQ